MQGRSLSHYEILDSIGSGGMGDVYRARDTKLDRDVALKVLRADLAADPERRARFLREAKAVAGLVHPNIVTVHAVDQAGEDGGTLFLTMELIEGPTLDHEIPPGGLRLPKLLDLAIPLADAVSFAHSKGVTHRDLKPSNIMIDAHGRLRVLDFGLVKLLEPADTGGDADATLQLARDATADGRILGTAAYMSPEQAQGLPVDHRTDIFSLGVLLYEMATGIRPFQGDTSVSTISSVLKDEPRPIGELNASLPRQLARIVHKCLAKDAANRYQTAQDLKTDLQGLKAETESGITEEHAPASPAKPQRKDSVAAGLRGWLPYLIVAIVVTGLVYVWQTYIQGPPSAEQSLEAMGGVDEPTTPASAPLSDRTLIAVLPFQNLGSPEDGYFAAGVTEELISRLSEVRGLGVIAKQTASRYADTDRTMAEIGRELGVAYVIDGSIRWDRSGDGPGMVRVTPHLTRVSDETQLWSDRYDESVEAIFQVQDRIAENIVTALGNALGGAPLVAGEGVSTENFEAHRLYLEARARDRGPFELSTAPEKVFDPLEQAVALDPGFVEAWAFLCQVHALMVHYSIDTSEERRALARQAADRVEELAPGSVLSHLALGYYYYHARKQYDRALQEFEATGQLDSNPEVMEAVAFVNRRMGNFDRALELQEKAVVLDPGNSSTLYELRGTYEALKRFDDAGRILLREKELRPDDGFLDLMLGFNRSSRTGDIGEMRRILEQQTDSDFPGFHLAWSLVHALEGDYRAALESLDRFPLPAMETPDDYIQKSAVRLRYLIALDDPGVEDAGETALTEVDAAVAERPGDWRRRQARAQVLALLGRRDGALRDAQLGVDMMPITKDAMFGVGALRRQAYVRIDAGDIAGGVAQLRELLAIPYSGMTVNTLRLSLELAPHRNEPAVRELLDQAS